MRSFYCDTYWLRLKMYSDNSGFGLGGLNIWGWFCYYGEGVSFAESTNYISSSWVTSRVIPNSVYAYGVYNL